MPKTSYTVTIDSNLWEKFKATITKDKTINDAIEELIKEKVNAK